MMKIIIFSLFIAAIRAAPHFSDFVCPEKVIANGCKGPKDCVFPNPNSCFNFIYCDVHNKTATPVVLPCAPATPPLEWNDNKKHCDRGPSPTCNKISTVE